MSEVGPRIEAVVRDLVMEKGFVPLGSVLGSASSAAGLFDACVARIDDHDAQIHAFLVWHKQDQQELAWRCESLRQALERVSAQVRGRIVATVFLVTERVDEMGALELALSSVREGHFLEKILIGRVAVAFHDGTLHPLGSFKPNPNLDWFEARFLSQSAHSSGDAAAIIEKRMRDERRTRQLLTRGSAWATWALIAANSAMFVVELILAGSYAAQLGNGQDSDASMNLAQQVLGVNQGQLVFGQGEWWRLFACMFLHANWLHLALNMGSLFSVGTLVERFGGSSKFLGIYLVAGLVGSLMSATLSGGGSLGASGAIMGLAGALIALNWRRPDGFPQVLARRIYSSLIWPVIFTFAMGIGLDFYNGPILIDNWAHFGGFSAGFLMVWLWPTLLQKPLRQSPAI